MNPLALTAYPWVLLALCLWREARGCSTAEIQAIAHVIGNRVTDPQKRYGADLVAVITAPAQFSSIKPPAGISAAEVVNATSWPAMNDTHWLLCCHVAESIGQATDGADPTGGATNYYSDPIGAAPAWAIPSKETAHIGVFHFFKL